MWRCGIVTGRLHNNGKGDQRIRCGPVQMAGVFCDLCLAHHAALRCFGVLRAAHHVWNHLLICQSTIGCMTHTSLTTRVHCHKSVQFGGDRFCGSPRILCNSVYDMIPNNLMQLAHGAPCFVVLVLR